MRGIISTSNIFQPHNNHSFQAPAMNTTIRNRTSKIRDRDHRQLSPKMGDSNGAIQEEEEKMMIQISVQLKRKMMMRRKTMNEHILRNI